MRKKVALTAVETLEELGKELAKNIRKPPDYTDTSRETIASWTDSVVILATRRIRYLILEAERRGVFEDE